MRSVETPDMSERQCGRKIVGRRHSPNDDITRATDVTVVGKRAFVSLSVVLVLVCSLPNVTLSAPNRRAFKVSRRHV